MLRCDVCGTLNFRENNYCTHCGNRLILENICPYCGEFNLNDATYCIKCSQQINPVTIENFDIFFSDYNNDLLKNASVSDIQYNHLLTDIFIRLEYSEIYGATIKDKIISLASVFSECSTKSRGYERGFNFYGNHIYYDDRLDESVQIATIIHELAHYLFFAIIEKLLCHIFKVNSSSTLQSFVWFFLTRPEYRIMNEYCAHTVEGRFIPFGYQNYGSFNMLIEQDDYDRESLEDMVIIGNTFANEIIVYLEKYIKEDLRNEIKLQYKKDLISPHFESIVKETDVSIEMGIKNYLIIGLLYDIFSLSKDSDDVRRELENIKEGIESQM